MAPDVPRDLERQPELAPLVVDGDLVAVVRAREPTLRAQAEVLQRHVLRRRLDAPLEIVLPLELGDFRADQPEHHRLLLRHEPERLEASRAVRVVSRKNAFTFNRVNTVSATGS